MPPAAGNPQGADAPHVPTAAQLTALAALQATAAAALVTYQAGIETSETNRAAYQAAQTAVTNYQSYIYGGNNKPGIYDEGTPDVV